VQADPLRTRVHGLRRFVTVKGGAYFFMPSINALRHLASCGLSREEASKMAPAGQQLVVGSGEE